MSKLRRNAPKIGLRTEAENHSKIEQKWKLNGANMEPKRHPIIDVFLARFWNASGHIGGTAGGLRRGCGPAAAVTLSPADSSGRRHIIEKYCRIMNKNRKIVKDLARPGPLARRFVFVLFVFCALPYIFGALSR